MCPPGNLVFSRDEETGSLAPRVPRPPLPRGYRGREMGDRHGRPPGPGRIVQPWALPKSVRGTHATAVGVHRGAVGPERSVVRLFTKLARENGIAHSRRPTWQS